MSELYQAYQNSMATYEYKSAIVPNGLFAVVECSTAYCPITDATLPGYNRYVHGLYGSRRIAEYYATKRANELSEYDEVFIEVWPKAPFEAQAFYADDETRPF